MSIRVMSQVWDLALPAFEKLVLLALADCANDEGLCWPSIATVKRKTGASERTVQRAIRALETLGILTTEQVLGKSCRYVINPRHIDTPVRQAPVSERRQPPSDSHPTPVTVTPKPSKNHQEPSNDCASRDALTLDELVEGWNELADACGLARVVKLNTQRRRQAKARMREYPDIADWQTVFKNLRNAGWMHGDNDRGWRADFDFVLQPKSFVKLLENSYARQQTH